MAALAQSGCEAGALYFPSLYFRHQLCEGSEKQRPRLEEWPLPCLVPVLCLVWSFTDLMTREQVKGRGAPLLHLDSGPTLILSDPSQI